MKTLPTVIAAAVVLVASLAANAQEWTYVYGGVDDPTSPGNGWDLYGNGPAAQWNLDTGDGHKAIRILIDDAALATKYYQRPVETSSVCAVWQIRFKLVGGQGVAGNQPHFWRMRWRDLRSRLALRSDIVGGSGKDFHDPDIPVTGGPLQRIAAWDDGWHTYTVIMVDDAEDISGAYAYWDGHFAHYRPPGLTTDDNKAYFGIVAQPPAGYPDTELWVDYFAWGFPEGTDLTDWGDAVRDNGTITALSPTVLTDSTKNWTPGEFAGEWVTAGSREYRIQTNGTNTITITSGDMLADGVTVGNNYRICRDALASLPPLDPDRPNAGNRIRNPEFDEDAAGIMQPTNYKCYPAISPPPSIPEWAVRRFYAFDSKPHRTNRMYGGVTLGDSVSEVHECYLYQTYTTKLPDDPLPATFYASACALTLSEGGDPTNCRVRVGIGKNLVNEDNPLDPSIVWGDWVSTQGYPWQLTPSAQVQSFSPGDRLTVFVHLNQQREYEGKYNLTLVDSVWLNTKPYPLIRNIRLWPINAECTEFRVQWETSSPGTSEVWHYDYTYERTKWAYGPSGVTTHTVDLTNLLHWNPETQLYEPCWYEYEVKTDEIVANNNHEDESGRFRTGPDVLTPIITSGPTVNEQTATVIWDTNVPTNTCVDFEPRGVGDLKTSPWVYFDPTETTHHEAVLTDTSKVVPGAGEAPIAPGDTIWYRVRSRNTSGYRWCVSAWQGEHDYHTGRFQWNPVLYTGDIGAVRQQPDGTLVRCSGKTVTGFFEEIGPTSVYTFFYIEERDRSAGIKVHYDGYFFEGTIVNVEGILHTVNGEKQIDAVTVDDAGAQTPLAPVGMTCRTACAPCTAAGAASHGMLASLWGNVTWVDFANGFFYLDDGSNYLDGTTHDEGGSAHQNRGIRVRCFSFFLPSELEVGKFVIVPKCCIGRTTEGTGQIPVAWVQNGWEITVLP